MSKVNCPKCGQQADFRIPDNGDMGVIDCTCGFYLMCSELKPGINIVLEDSVPYLDGKNYLKMRELSTHDTIDLVDDQLYINSVPYKYSYHTALCTLCQAKRMFGTCTVEVMDSKGAYKDMYSVGDTAKVCMILSEALGQGDVIIRGPK